MSKQSELSFTDYTKILFMQKVITKKQYADINFACRARQNQLDRMEEARIRRLDKAESNDA